VNTARTVVIDEDQNEASCLLQALGHAGIGAAYFAGDNPDLLPPSPIHGVRVVFLDLQLLRQHEAKNYIPHTVTVLNRCVHFSPRTTGIICWTKHTEEIGLLEAELAAKGIIPAFLHNIPDKALLTTTGPDGIKKLVQQVASQLSQRPGHRLLFNWERLIHDAASETTVSLLELSKDDNDLTRLLGAVALSSADEMVTSPESAGKFLSSGLVAVHSDSVEELIDSRISEHACKNLFDTIKNLKANRLDAEKTAKLNSVLLTTQASTFRPGNVYLTDANGLSGISKNEFVAFISELCALQAEKDGKPSAKAEEIAKNSVAVCVEVTPACDHAQCKAGSSRAVCGLLIKNDGGALKAIPAQSRVFAKELETVWLEDSTNGLKGMYKVVLNARYLISVNARPKVQRVMVE
jgi:hypothetical protein